MKYLSTQDVILLHDLAISQAGGSHGLRDLRLLDSAVNRYRASFGGQDLYPDIFRKASALAQSIIKNHPFVDGNKRSGVYAAMTFLELNGFQFKSGQDELVSFALAIENENLELPKIAAWLKAHTQRKTKG